MPRLSRSTSIAVGSRCQAVSSRGSASRRATYEVAAKLQGVCIVPPPLVGTGAGDGDISTMELVHGLLRVG